MRFLLLILMVSSSQAYAQFEDHFGAFKGTIVIYDQQNDRYTIHNAVETDVVADINSTLIWDKKSYPEEAWWPRSWIKQHNLKSAIKHSVVPLYRDIAWKIGTERMTAFLTRFDYGNQDISSGIDSFWLNGSIKISATEQVRFLQ